MREIKFRAWNNRIGKMLDTFVLDSKGEVYATAFKNDDQITLMQYTGLKDKNGKEIYEGDIVKLRGHTGDVYFALDKGQFRLEFVEKAPVNLFQKKLRGFSMRLFNNEGEVIGNIYENKELLKEK